MVDVREDVGSGKGHVPEEPAETVPPPHPPSSPAVEQKSASLSVKEPPPADPVEFFWFKMAGKGVPHIDTCSMLDSHL